MAPLWASDTCKRISAFYLDEAHSIHESRHWRPSYGRIYRLRQVIQRTARAHGYKIHIPIVAMSATCPSVYQQSVVTYGGLNPDYEIINLGNYRSELTHVIIQMRYDVSSFKDLTFLLPFGCQLSDIEPMLGYTDDIERLTKMFWWFLTRLASMGFPTDLVDIIHAGLSEEHQDVCLADFRAGKTCFLLGSDKIGAGMNFNRLPRVFQYMASGVTIPRWAQRRGRGDEDQERPRQGISLLSRR